MSYSDQCTASERSAEAVRLLPILESNIKELEQKLAEAESKLAQAVEVVRFYGDSRCSWNILVGEIHQYIIIDNSDVEKLPVRIGCGEDVLFGGRRAREFLAKLEEGKE
jgi:hypothetical protein